MTEILWGLGATIIVAVLAWRLRALDVSGAIAAVIVGTTTFGIGGLGPSVALIAFFLSGSILSALPQKKEILIADESQGRNWKQVMANGGLPAFVIFAARFFPSIEIAAFHFYYGVIAASAADSWATELGTRYGTNARDILTGRNIKAAMSGGVSVFGTLSSFAGAIFIALACLLPFSSNLASFRVFVAIITGGFLGATLDSVLGSSVQAVYWCDGCKCTVETPKHCTRPAVLIKGYSRITNNAVNFVSSGIGGLFVAALLDFAR